MIRDIEDWLASAQDYSIGIALYEKYGSNSALKYFFRCGETALSRRKLVEAITALRPQKKEPVVIPKYTASDLSAELQIEWHRKIDLFKEASALHSDLFYATTNEERKQLREKIVGNFKEIAAIWKRSDEYILQHPPVVDPVIAPKTKVQSIADLFRQQQNKRSAISRAKRTNPEAVGQLMAELKEIQRKIARS